MNKWSSIYAAIKKTSLIQRLARARLIQRIRGTYRVRRLAKTQPCKIVVGSMGIHEPGWIPTDISFLNLVKPYDWKRCFWKNWLQAILAEHVWEHLTREEGILAAQICFQYLEDGGYLRVAVPDGLHPDRNYIEWVCPGGSGYSAKKHKVLYTYRTLTEIFESVGFHVLLLEYYDENGQFHYEDWNPDEGMIHRSSRFDRKKREGILNYTSLILDARKHLTTAPAHHRDSPEAVEVL